MITEQSGIPPQSALRQRIYHAEHSNCRTGRATARLLTARAVIAQHAAAITAKAVLKRNAVPRAPLRTAQDFKCVLWPGRPDDAHFRRPTRRFAVAAAVIAAGALAAVAVRRAR